MENPIKVDDLGVPLFLETPILQSHLNPIDLASSCSSSVMPGQFRSISTDES